MVDKCTPEQAKKRNQKIEENRRKNNLQDNLIFGRTWKEIQDMQMKRGYK